MTARSVCDESCKDSRVTYLALLSAFPPIGMSQNKVNVVLDRSPECGRVSILYIGASAIIQVFHKIPKDLNGGFIARKRRDIIIADLR